MRYVTIFISLNYMQHVLKYYQSIINCNCNFLQTKASFTETAAKLKTEALNFAAVAGYMTNQEKTRNLEKFENGHTKILISSDRLSRGVEFTNVNIVISFDLQRNADNNPCLTSYLMRCSRVGRFGRPGVSITLAEQRELTNFQSDGHIGIETIDL